MHDNEFQSLREVFCKDLLFQAKQFGVHLFSSSIELKDRLIGDPPKDVKAAKKSLNIWTIDLMIGIF